MKIVSMMALGLALATVPLATPAIAKEKPAESGGIKISPKLTPIVQEIQKAQAAKDWATVKAKADEAVPLIATPDDKLYIGNVYVGIGQNTNDNAAVGKGVDLMIESGKTDAATLPKLITVQWQLAFQAKNYPKAEAALIQAVKMNPADVTTIPVLVESQRLQAKNVQALQTLNDAIGKQLAAGQPVPNEWYQRGFTIAYNVKAGSPDYAAVRPIAIEINKQWLGSYPTGANWHDVLLYNSQGKSSDTELMLDSRRLGFATNGLVGVGEYVEYADATYTKNPGEAKAVIEAGAKKGVYTIAGNKALSEINGIASGRIAADKASLANSEKTAQNNAKVALAVGDAYYGYANWAKAVEMYKLAIAKGADADLANLRIGASLANSGDAAGAKAAFAQVKGGPRKELADLWVVHLAHPTAG